MEHVLPIHKLSISIIWNLPYFYYRIRFVKCLNIFAIFNSAIELKWSSILQKNMSFMFKRYIIVEINIKSLL